VDPRRNTSQGDLPEPQVAPQGAWTLEDRGMGLGFLLQRDKRPTRSEAEPARSLLFNRHLAIAKGWALQRQPVGTFQHAIADGIGHRGLPNRNSPRSSSRAGV
jgi:hypothetical protein